MLKRIVLVLVVVGAFIAGGVSTPIWPSQAREWIEADTQLASTDDPLAVDGQLIETVTPDAVRPSNTTFEVLPQAGAMDRKTETVREGSFRGERTSTRTLLEVHIRNLTGSTLKTPYWKVTATGQTRQGWVASDRPATIGGRQIAPGETSKLPTQLAATFAPKVTAVRFTVTYAEPGMTASSATIEYPW